VDISCAFATSPETPRQVAIAEELGYRRAWCYDSPALYPDVWMTLALAAGQTSSIGLGPAVLVPSLRHPMVNAAAIATLAALAPGRVSVAIGAGFTGRYTLGQRAMRWSDVAEYVRVLQALLRGEEVSWEGALIKMIHPDGFIPDRPIADVPVLIGADGPKGYAVAQELGDGVIGAGFPPAGDTLPPWRAMLAFGTVLDDAEELTDERVLDAAGHAVAVLFHSLYERAGAEGVDAVAGGQSWREAVEAVPQDRRHLAIHEGHLVSVSERDRPAVAEGVSLLTVSLTGSPSDLRNRVDELAAAGVSEIAYQPAGSDIAGELERFIKAVG
jgi:5,10-methylenetetrahydromethanopterin reductase